MDDMINRHDSIAEENIEPNGRPAKNEFEEWSTGSRRTLGDIGAACATVMQRKPDRRASCRERV